MKRLINVLLISRVNNIIEEKYPGREYSIGIGRHYPATDAIKASIERITDGYYEYLGRRAGGGGIANQYLDLDSTKKKIEELTSMLFDVIEGLIFIGDCVTVALDNKHYAAAEHKKGMFITYTYTKIADYVLVNKELNHKRAKSIKSLITADKDFKEMINTIKENAIEL